MVRFHQVLKISASFMILLGLSGCNPQTGQQQTKSPMALDEILSIRSAIPEVTQNKSVLVVRVSKDGSPCNPSGTVRITPVVAGRLSPEQSINVGYSNLAPTSQGLKSMAITLGNVAKLDFSAAERENSMQMIRTSFVSVPPGDYVVTHVRCESGNSATTLGGGNTTGWLPAGAGSDRPVLGDNFITVPPGRIVAAGSLDIVQTSDAGFGKSATGKLVSRPADEEFWQEIKTTLPNIYAKTIFRQFSAKYP